MHMCVDQKGKLDDTCEYYLFRQIAAYERFIRQHFTFDFHYAICCSKGFVSLIWFPISGRERGPKTVNTHTHTHIHNNASFVGHFGPTRARTSPQVPAIIYNNPRMAHRKDQRRRRRPIRPGHWRYAIDIHSEENQLVKPIPLSDKKNIGNMIPNYIMRYKTFKK